MQSGFFFRHSQIEKGFAAFKRQGLAVGSDLERHVHTPRCDYEAKGRSCRGADGSDPANPLRCVKNLLAGTISCE